MNSALHWELGDWSNAPISAIADSDGLLVEAAKGSDACVTTSYGFVIY